MTRATRMVMRIGVAAAVLAAVTPSLAWAAEGMPQLNFANPLTVAQAVWLLVIFGGLYMLVKDWGLPQVAAVVDARNASITADLEAARQAKVAGDAAVAELNAVTRKAQADAQGQINDAVTRAKQAAAAQAAEANARLEAQLAEAEKQIHAARTAAMGALREVADETCHLILGRLLGGVPDRAATNAAVGDAIAARGLG